MHWRQVCWLFYEAISHRNVEVNFNIGTSRRFGLIDGDVGSGLGKKCFDGNICYSFRKSGCFTQSESESRKLRVSIGTCIIHIVKWGCFALGKRVRCLASLTVCGIVPRFRIAELPFEVCACFVVTVEHLERLSQIFNKYDCCSFAISTCTNAKDDWINATNCWKRKKLRVTLQLVKHSISFVAKQLSHLSRKGPVIGNVKFDQIDTWFGVIDLYLWLLYVQY